MKRYVLILLAFALIVVASFITTGDQCQFDGVCTTLETADRWLEYGAVALFVIGLIVYLLGFKKKEI